MKTLITISVLAALLCSAIHPAHAQLKNQKIVLNKNQAEKLKVVKPSTNQYSFLQKKGIKTYNTEELKNSLGINLDHLPRLTLEQLKWKLRATPESMMSAPQFFQQNIGQSKSNYNYIVQSAGFTAGFNKNNIRLMVLKSSSKMEKLTSSPKALGNTVNLEFKNSKSGKLTGGSKVDAAIRSIKGKSPRLWHADIPSFDYLVTQDLYKGINLIQKIRSGRLLYSFVLKPGVKINTIHITVNGCEKIYLDRKGNLVMQTSGGPIVQTRPKFFQTSSNGQQELKGQFVIYGPTEYGFTVTNNNPQLPLLIDPEIVFASYFGGSGQEGMLGTDNGAGDFIGRGFDIQLGPQGDIFLVGRTSSADFPVSDGGLINGNIDIFVMRINTNFQLVYSVFIGGSSEDRGRSITVTEKNVAYITGFTFSNDFPTCPDTTSGCTVLNPAGTGAYVAKLDPGGAFLRGTYLGDNPGSNHPNSIKYELQVNQPAGHIYIGGATEGSTDATTGSFQETFAGDEDGFVAKLDTNLSQLVYYSYLGGTGNDFVMDLDVKEGFAFVTGMTASTDFPTTFEAHAEELIDAGSANCTGTINPRQCADAFITRFNDNGSDLIYSTYFGESGKEDFARGIAVNEDKDAFITGASRSVNDTTTNIFMAKFTRHGDLSQDPSIISSQNRDHGEEIVVDQFNIVHITGTLSLPGLQVGENALAYHGGDSDIFYARFLENGQLNLLTYLGGEDDDRGFAIAASSSSDDEFCATIVGSTVSDDVTSINPLPGGEERSGNADILLFTLCNLPFDVNSIGSFSKSASPTVTRGGNIRFDLTVNNTADVEGPVTVVDNLSSCIENITVSTSFGAGCTVSNNQVTCNFNARASGPSTISITGRVSNNCPCSSPISNSATLRVFGREVSSNRTTTTLQGCPPPPPPPPPCGNGVCEPNLGENCNNCVDCPKDELNVNANCLVLENCETCPPGTTCREVIAGIMECHDCCSNVWLNIIPFYCLVVARCDNCGDALVTRVCTAN